ncbi:MAG: ABC transporter ATP-binding protein [Clostridia bacterium]|nr:ABC transporter ATP-binding protein [Clostridia bacterium]
MENNDVRTPVLKCKGLSKKYKGGAQVFKNFDFLVNGGRIYGLLGPNGCGKSTLIKLVCGLLVPDEGEIEIAGQPRSERTNSLVSYLPERTYFDSNMKVSELIAYFLDFYSDFDSEIAHRMLSDLGICESQKLSELSKGMKEKVQLVMVMSRRAKLYLLDEPIAGVDPAARDYILRTIISAYNPEAAVIITTHLIYDIEPVLDEFIFLGRGGSIKLCGNCDEVREREGKSLNQLFLEVFK